MRRLHHGEQLREEIALNLDEIARAGAKRMLAEALEAEVRGYLEAARGERDEHGRALVVRNGHARERQVVLGAGAVEVTKLPGSTTAGWTKRATGGDSRV